MTEDFTHVDEDGAASMVDVGDKPASKRRATAEGTIKLTPTTVTAIQEESTEKGDVLATARIGTIQAVKHTWETIPLCHQIPITNVETNMSVESNAISLQVTVETTGQTGCEMEAIQGVTTGLGVIWDMVKAIEKDEHGEYPDTAIQDVHVLEKTVKRPENEDTP